MEPEDELYLAAVDADYELDVVTPTFNGLPFLKECVASVGQLPFPVHHVVVDGGSDDGSRAFLERARRENDHLTVVVRSDRGPADALNSGLESVRSQRVTVLNADDRFITPPPAAAWDTMRRRSRECVVQCDARVIDEQGAVIGVRKSDRFTRRGWAVRGRRLVHPGSLVPSRYFQDGVRFDPENRSSWDVQLFLDLADRGAEFCVVPAMVVDFRLHPESISGSGRLQQIFEEERARMAKPILAELPVWVPLNVVRIAERAVAMAERVAAATRR